MVIRGASGDEVVKLLFNVGDSILGLQTLAQVCGGLRFLLYRRYLVGVGAADGRGFEFETRLECVVTLGDVLLLARTFSAGDVATVLRNVCQILVVVQVAMRGNGDLIFQFDGLFVKRKLTLLVGCANPIHLLVALRGRCGGRVWVVGVPAVWPHQVAKRLRLVAVLRPGCRESRVILEFKALLAAAQVGVVFVGNGSCVCLFASRLYALQVDLLVLQDGLIEAEAFRVSDFLIRLMALPAGVGCDWRRVII